MSDIDNDPFAVAFGRFRAEVDDEVRPIGVAATRAEVGRRHRRRGVALGIAIVVAITVPVTAFAVTDRHSTAVPSAPVSSRSPSPSPSPTPSSVSKLDDGVTVPIHPSSIRTASTSVSGTLMYVARTGEYGGDMNATVITVSGTRIAEQHVGDPAWGDTPPPMVETGMAPDGVHIAFLGNGRTAGLNVSKIDGSDLHEIDDVTDNACGSPEWSPDSTRIVYARPPGPDSDYGHDDVTVINPDGSGPKTLGVGCYPVFSVDGSQVAYVDPGGGLDIVNVDGTGHRIVTSELGANGIQTIMTVDHDHAIVDLGLTPCCDTGGTRHRQLVKPYVVDLTTGKATALTSRYGTVSAAFYTPDGAMVLRVAVHGPDRPGRVVFLGPSGAETASFDESQLSAPGYGVKLSNIDLVGYQLPQ